MPPNRPNPRPPAPIRSMSRRETPQPDNRVLVVMVFALLMYFHENRLGSAPRDSDIPAHDDQGAVGLRGRPSKDSAVRHRSPAQIDDSASSDQNRRWRSATNPVVRH